jgi:uroporphyrinogen decarboxylase
MKSEGTEVPNIESKLQQQSNAAERRSDYLRAARFERPNRIPTRCVINGACWNHHSQDDLEELMASHPLLFPDYRPLPRPFVPTFLPDRCANTPFRDEWGCLWKTTDSGIMGTVVEHPLEDWGAFEHITPPDPDTSTGRGPMDWVEAAKDVEPRKSQGDLISGHLRHGHTFLTLSDLRGYQNLMYDMADDEPLLHRLIEMVEAFNRGIVDRYLAMGIDRMNYPEDLGMQNGPMVSPPHFRKYIKPSYQRLMRPAVEKGVIVHMHSDGDIRSLTEDLLDCGVEVFNIQDLVNGLDWIEAEIKGRVCVELDIDRQSVTCFGTPLEIDSLIRGAVDTLGDPQGGLMLCYGLYPGTPLANAQAVMDAMEKYVGYFS